jgi:Cu/Ag efflux pump CusA
VAPFSLLIFLPLFDAFSWLKKAILVLINVFLALIRGLVTLGVFLVPLAVSVAFGFFALGPSRAERGGDAVALSASLGRRHSRGRCGARRRAAAFAHRADECAAVRAWPASGGAKLSRDIGAKPGALIALVVTGGPVSAALSSLIVLQVLYASRFAPGKDVRETA